jgi:hypothetical protein
MNFITFNIIMIMIKMSLEQVQIIGLEFSILALTFLNHLVVLDEYIEIWSLGIVLIFIMTIFQTYSNSKPQSPLNLNNITF